MIRSAETKTHGKAASLTVLRESGFNVPSFFTCDRECSKEELFLRLEKFLPNGDYLAIRSSAENEDSADSSYAGQFYSAVGVPRENAFKEFLKVVESFGERGGEVIIQTFIPSDVGGVIFATENLFVINSNFGLCGTVVNGYNCDEYICDRERLLISQKIPETKKAEVFTDGGIVTKEVTNTDSLGDTRRSRLLAAAGRIRELFGCDQDIEWCFADDELFILQSRPVTKEIPATGATYFDSANIAESYSGIVLPLTCSFAKMVYERVYKDLLYHSGVSRKKIEEHSYVFENLLGFFYGRMYYNMNNWYLMAAFFPGYKIHKANFELMITSNVRENIVSHIKPTTVFTAIYPFILIAKVLTFKISVWYFTFMTRRDLRRYRGRDIDTLDESGCRELFGELNRKTLRRWYITLENDFLVMTFLGLLRKLVDEKDLVDILAFQSKTGEQVSDLRSLCAAMQADEKLWSAVQRNDAVAFNRHLSQNRKAGRLLEEHLIAYGGRFANELKLESVGIDEDPAKLFSLLRLYADHDGGRKQAPQIKGVTLPFFKRILFFVILRQFRKVASRREDFRLLRSNVFAVNRKLFRRIGTLFAKRGIVEEPDDIFYLQVDEVMRAGERGASALLDTVHERKGQYAGYGTVTPLSHFSTYDDRAPLRGEGVGQERGRLLQGTPTSVGTVRGRVRVFREFFMPEEIDFDIIVAAHTDPGWTSLIALAKGVIVENGGVLSHASIVTRELGIPAVIGVDGAVEFLQDGDVVEIDGSSGSIALL